jgi:hypothetical protein
MQLIKRFAEETDIIQDSTPKAGTGNLNVSARAEGVSAHYSYDTLFLRRIAR